MRGAYLKLLNLVEASHGPWSSANYSSSIQYDGRGLNIIFGKSFHISSSKVAPVNSEMANFSTTTNSHLRPESAYRASVR